jgi:mannose-6-phosphate isomerase-like protein (cupin superfamily)
MNLKSILMKTTTTTSGHPKGSQPETKATGSGNMLRVAARSVTNPEEIQPIDWSVYEEEKLTENISRQMMSGERSALTRFYARKGTLLNRLSNRNEVYIWVVSGILRIELGAKELQLHAAEAVRIPAGVPYEIEVTEDALYIEFSSGQGKSVW